VSARGRAAAALLALAALISACGDDIGPAADDAGATGTPAGAYPVTVEHHFGTVELAQAPERVVSLGYTDQDAIVLFGVEPIAVRYAFGPEDDLFFPWADEQARDADPEVLPRAEVNVEQVAALDPDLIMAVTAGLTREQYDTLSAVAPVVVQPKGYPDYGTPWDVHTLLAGRVFGQEERAQEIVDDVHSQVADAVSAHPELAGRTVALSGPTYDGEYPFHASSDVRTRFFTDLGLVVPAALDEIAGSEFYGTVSRERADLLDVDVLLFQSGSAEERSAIEADPILAGLAAVGDGRSLFVEGTDYDALQFSSALSLPYLLEHLVPKLAALPAPG
jgi:iron complex transport system substrate-binding protein